MTWKPTIVGRVIHVMVMHHVRLVMVIRVPLVTKTFAVRVMVTPWDRVPRVIVILVRHVMVTPLVRAHLVTVMDPHHAKRVMVT
jgi:hypothetical protein